MKDLKWIEVVGARQHNLKNLTVRIPKENLTVVTGPSGSGKSSLAFDTLFAEGQRRYMESLSTYARQFLDKQEKPDVDEIKGLSPTLAIEQKNHTKNSRSTVGTATEVYDYLRLIFSKLGIQKSPETGEIVKRNLISEIVEEVKTQLDGQKAGVIFPVELASKSKIAERRLLLGSFMERGYTRALASLPAVKKGTLEFLDIQEELTKKNSKLTGSTSSAPQIWILVDRFVIDSEVGGRLEDALVRAYGEGFGRSRVIGWDDSEKLIFEGRYTDYPSTDDGTKRYPEPTPLFFSFNSPAGACPTCKGFGNILQIDPSLVVPHDLLSISQGAIEPLTKPSAKHWLKKLLLFCQNEKIPLSIPWRNLSPKDKEKIWKGAKDFEGIEGFFSELEDEKYKVQIRVFISHYRSPKTCPDCDGQRLRIEARNVFFRQKSISELCKMPLGQLLEWFKGLKFNKKEAEIGKDLFPQIRARLEFLVRVGLDYLTLDRLAKTLSGGEAQRIALANQLGSRLTQTTYVLDEPSIGLHPRDTERLISLLKDLVSLRNTVVVVEHDPDVIKSADYLVDLGPDAGERGGELLFADASRDFEKKGPKTSWTHRFMFGGEAVPMPLRRRTERIKDKSRSQKWIEIEGCSENNLKNVKLKIPLGTVTCVTGVSGSGKSSAVRKTLFPALSKILLQTVDSVGRFEKIRGFEELKSVQLVTQEPIGRSPRSNPVTFMKTYDEIRSLFAATMEARKKNFHPGFFSFNVPGGRCDVCEGDGALRVEMVFMEDLFIPCEACQGKRFKKEVLDISFKGKNIHDVLGLTVNEARKFFAGESPRLTQTLNTLAQVGLGYLRLGQPSTTLSGGESQRLKIARELALSEPGHCLYILDEPTTGLHFRDVKILIRVLHQLVEKGNSVVVIEHNTDVMKSSDWIVDFGPEGGEKGGLIVAEGPPEEIVRRAKGFTWKYLAPALDSAPKVSVPDFLSEVEGGL